MKDMEVFGKLEAKMIACESLGNKTKILELLQKTTGDSVRDSMKSAWVLSTMTEEAKGSLDEFVTEIITCIAKSQVGGTKRELIKCLILSGHLESDQKGFLVDKLIHFMISPAEDMAVRYNSMKVMQRIVKEIPDLKDEFHSALEISMETASPTYQKLARSMLKGQ